MQVTVSSLVSAAKNKPATPAQWKRLETKVWKVISESKEINDEHLLFAIYRGQASVKKLIDLANDRKENLSNVLNRPLQEMKIFGKSYGDGRNSALHFAMLSGEPGVVSLLCKAGAQVSDALLTYWLLKNSDIDGFLDKEDASLSKYCENWREMIQVLKEHCISKEDKQKLSEQDKKKMEAIELVSSATVVLTKAAEKFGLLPNRKRKRRESDVWDVLSSLF